MKTEWPQGLKMCKFFYCLLLTSSALLAVVSVYAQKKDVRFSLTAKQIPLKEIIYKIRVQTGLQAFFSNEHINVYQKFDVDFKNAKLDEVLRTLLDAKKFKWYIREEAIVIALRQQKNATDSVQKKKDSSRISMIGVSGIVTNEAGKPLAGATVYLKGSKSGASTDSKGRFSFAVDNILATLVISCVGYQTMITKVGTKKKVIRLEAMINSLDETVIFGYGSTTRRMLTGSISRITGKEISRQPIANPLQALQGTVTGLNVLQVTGLPGSDYRVELRGRNSIGSGNNPLYIVDGIPFPSTPLTWDIEAGDKSIVPPGWRIGFGSNMSYNILNAINPADIESMEILKDADATAIYGSRAANGVVLITTKKGVAGKPQATLNIYRGIGRLGHSISYLNTEQYLAMRRDAFKNDGETPTPENAPDLTKWDSTQYTDWQRTLIGGTAQITNAQASLSGGSSSVQYHVSAGYRKETTVYPGSFSYQRSSLRGNLTYISPNQRVKGSLFAAYVNDLNKLLNEDLTYSAVLPPNVPDLVDGAGNILWPQGMYNNPYAAMLRTYRAQTDNLSLGANWSLELLPGLELKANGGMVDMQVQETQINPIKSANPSQSDSTGFSDFGNTKFKNWVLEPQLRYQKEYGKGKLDVILGATFQGDTRDQQGWRGTGYRDDALLEDKAAAPNVEQLEGTQYNNYRYNAIFGRLYYAFDSKYLINLTGRRDGSSRFGPGRQYATFGAAGVAWIFTQEKFARRFLPFLSFGKLRASYGITGNDQLQGNMLGLERYVPGPLFQGGAMFPQGVFNPYIIGWEKNRKTEVGLELGWIRDRILLRSSYYNNRSLNQSVKFPVSSLTGTTYVLANVPAVVANTGVELELKTVNVQSRHFTWTLTLNITLPRNRLVDFPGLELSPYNTFFTIGNPLDQFKGYHFTGVDSKTGVAQFEDMNRDGKLTPDDKQYTKSLFPRYYGGIQQSITYKGWELDLLFQFVGQNGYNYEFTPNVFQAPGFLLNQPRSILNSWKNPGDKTGIQRYSQSFATDAGLAHAMYLTSSDKMITDASFIRLKSLNLAYKIPEKWTKRWGIEGSKIYLQAQNLFTITRYPGRDVENAALPNANSYPPLRIWTAGVQLSF